LAEFMEEPQGTVVSMDVGDGSGSSFQIWFPYTRGYMSIIKEGCLVAVRNFSSSSGIKCFSILELASVNPVHYALGSSPRDTERAFPGFVVEAAKSARVDWEQEKPVEQTTKIRAESIATGVQLTFDGRGPPRLEQDQSLPMVGEEALLLDDELTNQVINRGMAEKGVVTISPCKMVLNPKIDVLIGVEDLLRTHFAIFGFTGAGKSNLMSNLVSNLMGLKSNTKILFFDLMSEYAGLLIDILNSTPNTVVLALDENSVPGGDATAAYLRGDKTKLAEAASSITRTLLLPKELVPNKSMFDKPIRALLEAKKVRVYDSYVTSIISSDVRSMVLPLVTGPIGTAEAPLRAWIDNQLPASDQSISVSDLKQMLTQIQGFLSAGITASSGGNLIQLSPTGREVLAAIQRVLRKLTSPLDFPPESKLQFDDLQKLLNSEEGPGLILVQSNDDDALRTFAAGFIERVFDSRRREGKIAPQILLVFDEADAFIPQQAENSYALSKATINTIARRGRKFGMGIGLATQRVAYLDTTILAQPHTYFISKLPRAYDRESVSNAFGIAEDMLSRTLRFTKGQWLLVSFEATGLENVPIPVQFPNTNVRIKNYLHALTEGASGRS
jgi:DNA helicase HerA-like ATPase